MAVIYGPVFGFDPDAADYFARIAAAGSSITETNKTAVNNFIKGCKADGIWTAIKASCLLAGPDDLTGALVPLVGAAPTNNNFVAGDYLRTTGLVGDGLSKWLDSNFNGDLVGDNDISFGCWVSNALGAGTLMSAGRASTGACANITQSNNWNMRNRNNSIAAGGTRAVGFVGSSRSDSTGMINRVGGVDVFRTMAFQAVYNGTFGIFNHKPSPNAFAADTISFYSIGEALDLALLDARLATYMSTLT
jgi:hypothetical protein